ncbi:hypothetical protein SCP_0506910 [Sparassis crispa]|uniref:Uncharacterized protein n=1 Tax=Sparassis crispa TaxID=139825 RepID=A0A401GN48_9APHY|nr:hypothetical protein SCP_0506910 [Sparassis crispa]GBE83636.1 hypothetical protein SCP_0506910 [Sparassis crispa]
MQSNGGSLCKRSFSTYGRPPVFNRYGQGGIVYALSRHVIQVRINVAQVVRQSIDKMHEFRWTKPGSFNDGVDELVPVHAMARYHERVLDYQA